MADIINEKSPSHYDHGAAVTERPVTPSGWMYKQFKVGRFTLPWYASPAVQLTAIALVCFLCPGMFNALGGMGGTGLADPTLNDEVNCALYAVFAVVGFFAGSIVNWVGIRFSLAFGGLGYVIYVASFLCYKHTGNKGFSLFAGVLLGVCAGILWCAQGAIMLSYPSEKSKGKYISWFWIIFNFGAVIGSLINLGENVNNQGDNAVSDGTYVGFIVLTFAGAALAFSLVDAKRVVRSDGSKVILMKNPTWKTEILGLWETLHTDIYIVALFPMFFASNWFYAYQFNSVNLAYFNTRTRALNGTLYWLSQIIGAIIFGYALDIQRVRRTVRAKVVWAVLFGFTMIVWGGGYRFQKGYVRQPPGTVVQKMDWTSKAYVGPMFLYMFYGAYDAAWQTCVYWFLGSMSNNSRKLANFAGFYKGLQSAGAAVIFRIDSLGTPYMNELASCWALLAGSLLIAAPVFWFKIKDHVPLEEDLKMSDETAEDVQPTTEAKIARDDVA